MTMPRAERQRLVATYEAGFARLRDAWERVPAAARQWRPAAGKWSAHEIVCHCADSETNASTRIRYLVAEKEPVVLGYDQDEWARRFDYHAHPVDVALLAVQATRANTTALLKRLDEKAWESQGRHSESGPYGAEDWLRVYAEHLDKHASQIDRVLIAWRESAGRA